VDIVDGQVHANLMGTEIALAVMDALGIQAMLIDEYIEASPDGSISPNYKLSDGTYRPIAPNAEAAAYAHPERFSYLMRINPLDPDPEPWLRILKISPNFRAIRTGCGPGDSAESRALENGGFDGLFKVATKLGLPVFVTCPSRVPHLVSYARRFPDVQFIIDHCGAEFGGPPGKRSIKDTLDAAKCPNIALKWAHAPYFFSTQPFPFTDLEPTLKRVLDAFGPERILWASDYTVSLSRHTWAESLFAIRESPALSQGDKEWILGRTIRKLLDWPAPKEPSFGKSLHAHPL
jgi:L-fuconolactonase